MKCNTNKAISDKYIKENLDIIFDYCVEQLTDQIFATSLMVLEREYGFKRQRLLKFIKQVNELSTMIANMPGERSALDFDEYLEKHYNIDVKKELKIYKVRESKKKHIISEFKQSNVKL